MSLEKEEHTFKRLRLYHSGTDNYSFKKGKLYKDYFKRGLPIYRVKRVEAESKEEDNDG
jgi:hypothetical protein